MHVSTLRFRLSVVGIVFAALASSGCTILFALFQGTDGLPCRTPTANDARRCELGFTCIDGICRVAAALVEGDLCEADAQCDTGLVCRDRFFPGTDGCGDFFYDTSCTVGSSDETDTDGFKRCRRECSVDSECVAGQRCFPDEFGATSGFCQAGNCAVDEDCSEVGGGLTLCIGASVNPGDLSDTGLCLRACDPLECFDSDTASCGSCPDTEDIDGDGQGDLMGCFPRDFDINSSVESFVCEEINRSTDPKPLPGPGEACSNSERCNFRSFCSVDVPALQAANPSNDSCFEYCRLGGGTPACPVGKTCSGVLINDIGYCL